ncbi:Phospholipid-transporting ATPase IA, partial [Halocaridina rubra]
MAVLNISRAMRLLALGTTRLTETARLLKNVFRRTTTRVNLEVELAHGFAFSQEEHGVIGQSEVIRAYDTTQPKPG